MTEAGWFARTDLQKMLEFLRGKAGDRRLRPFAYCHRIWNELVDERNRPGADQGESMDTTKLLLDLFGRLAEFLGNDYGMRLSLTAEAHNVSLRLATQKAVGRHFPTFVLTVRPEAGAFRIGYRPEGQPPAKPERRSVRFDRPDVEAVLFDVVRGFVEAERERLVECRQGR